MDNNDYSDDDDLFTVLVELDLFTFRITVYSTDGVLMNVYSI